MGLISSGFQSYLRAQTSPWGWYWGRLWQPSICVGAAWIEYLISSICTIFYSSVEGKLFLRAYQVHMPRRPESDLVPKSGCKTYHPREETKLVQKHWVWVIGFGETAANESGCALFKKTSTNVPVTMAVWNGDAWEFLASPGLCHSMTKVSGRAKNVKFIDFCTSLGSIPSVFAAWARTLG